MGKQVIYASQSWLPDHVVCGAGPTVGLRGAPCQMRQMDRPHPEPFGEVSKRTRTGPVRQAESGSGDPVQFNPASDKVRLIVALWQRSAVPDRFTFLQSTNTQAARSSGDVGPPAECMYLVFVPVLIADPGDQAGGLLGLSENEDHPGAAGCQAPRI
jgi:hypothetical protein